MLYYVTNVFQLSYICIIPQNGVITSKIHPFLRSSSALTKKKILIKDCQTSDLESAHLNYATSDIWQNVLKLSCTVFRWGSHLLLHQTFRKFCIFSFVLFSIFFSLSSSFPILLLPLFFVFLFFSSTDSCPFSFSTYFFNDQYFNFYCQVLSPASLSATFVFLLQR